MEKKYQFSGKDDIATLTYKDKKYEFKTNVRVVSEVQGLVAESRLRMAEELSKKGQSIRDLTIIKKDVNKTYEDNSNREIVEEYYLNKVTEEWISEKSKKIFNQDISSLMEDIGLETELEGEMFVTEFVTYLSGKFPSDEVTTSNNTKDEKIK